MSTEEKTWKQEKGERRNKSTQRHIQEKNTVVEKVKTLSSKR